MNWDLIELKWAEMTQRVRPDRPAVHCGINAPRTETASAEQGALLGDPQSRPTIIKALAVE